MNMWHYEKSETYSRTIPDNRETRLLRKIVHKMQNILPNCLVGVGNTKVLICKAAQSVS